jgi:ribose/xylose/arabinose/galactoside ABC-type transport system permease subunit
MLGGLDGALLAGYFRGANVDLGNEYLLASIAVVVIGGTLVAGGKANVPGVWGAALFLVLLLTMLNTFGVSAGLRLVTTGLIIVLVTSPPPAARKLNADPLRRMTIKNPKARSGRDRFPRNRPDCASRCALR